MSTSQEISDPAQATSSAQVKWPRYLEATLGFDNHWHPAAFDHELAEGEFVAVTMLGEKVLLTRAKGEVKAIADGCAHRGVPFSKEPLCFKAGTVSCWYHGWTYDLDDGRLVDVLTSPGSPVIGKIGIKVYPVQVAQGVVFVFIGDEEPHALSEDLPPGFLDEDTHLLGIRRTVQSNWRLGVENGFDTTHIFMHRNSPWVSGNRLAFPYGFVPADRDAMQVYDENWPKGVLDRLSENYMPVFEATLDGETVLSAELTGEEKKVAAQVSVWLPGVLKVDPFPDPTLIQYEFYVPISETQHEYFQVLQRKVEGPEDVKTFEVEFEERWRDDALHGFNDDDVWAREAQQEFYGERDGWSKEQLFPPDMCIVKWRTLASERGRGVRAARVEMS
ncbi:carbazole dioxygenase [Nocardioides aromaticivorans]|uniref:Carbazole dioxygenase n=2 Tax=Nocardioides TaxID=1839 RepID=Q2HWI0_9ACTN|nr:Rieske 2Fe-2S domain-containing protein [Nocardioides aromaticivorans]QSR24160.1 carbazole dioxygenase [Nocardioides aromaticivorans]BAE79498.1 terminal oxygenase component of carbazole 1,9a-dioxygenase [Nocardioides aromaticivorans]